MTPGRVALPKSRHPRRRPVLHDTTHPSERIAAQQKADADFLRTVVPTDIAEILGLNTEAPE